MEALAHKHLPLVRRIAWHIHGTMSSIVEVEDLIQIGLVALVEAAAAFEDRGQVTFEQYLATRVRGAMIDELRRQATLPRGAMTRRRQYNAAQNGRASGRGRVCQYVWISVFSVSIKKKNMKNTQEST